MSGRASGGTGPLDLLRAAPRLAAVVDVLRRHGFAEPLAGMGPWPAPERVRSAVEELGPVFIKLGQVLSTRRDVLPTPYADELELLQDSVSRLPREDIVKVVELELGGGPDAVFGDFDYEPLASASIAQVHAAVTHDGREVVVKVQRPGLDEQVREDLAALAQIASVLDATVPRLRPFDLPALVRDLRGSLEAELDFHREAANIRRFAASMKGQPGLWIPSPLEDLSGRRVITMERSHGARLQAYVDEHPGEGPVLARRLGRLFIRQVFRDGLFHADPHPGNFFVMPDGVICLHDFGMIGEVDERMREALVSLLDAVVAGDTRRATTAYLDLGLAPSNVDRQAIEAEVGQVVRDVRSRPLAEVSVGKALEGVIRVGARHRIRQPGAFMLLSRAFVTLEGVLSRLDPGLSFIEVFGSAMEETLGQRLSVDRVKRDAAQAVKALDRLTRDAPDDVRGVLRRWADGSLGRVVVAQDADEAVVHDRRARTQRRLLAAGFLSLTGAILSSGPDGTLRWAGLGLLGVGAGVLLVYSVRP